MPQIFRGFDIKEIVTRSGCDPESSVSLEFMDDDIEVLNVISKRYEVSAHALAFCWTPRKFRRPDPPWVILALTAHYPIGGHLIAARVRRSDFSFSYYGLDEQPYDPHQRGVPPAGMLFIFSPDGFAEAAARSPCVAAVSRNLESVSRRGNWLVIADPLAEDAVAGWERDNEELFWQAYG